MRAIVTGANGFVGSAVVSLLAAKGYDVLALDIASDKFRFDINDKHIRFLAFDMTNLSSLKNELKGQTYDLFFHFAWKGSAGPLRSDIATQNDNVIWTLNALKASKDIGCKRFIVAGSIMEFEAIEVMSKEGEVPPSSIVYSVAKLNAHYLCKAKASEIGVDLLWAYITNAYGVGETSLRFINATLHKIISNEALEFTSGTQNYDFVYVTDVAKAFVAIAEKGENYHSYLIGSGNAKPLKGFINEILDELKPTAKVTFGELPFKGINLSLSTYSAKPLFDLGYVPEVSFKDGIRKTYEWLKGSK